MRTLVEIEQGMSTPSPELVADVKQLAGDVMILGVSGKMGVTLAKLLKNAMIENNLDYQVYGVARFSDPASRAELEDYGIQTIAADFLNQSEMEQLPKIKNIIFMVGYKFGATGNEPYTWAVNSYLPGRICEYFKESRIVAFSTGCVYPLVPVNAGAPSEEMAPDPLGEYAQSCLGRERIFEHFSKENGTKVSIFRLNYAIDLKYGVVSELAKTILADEAVDLTMGHVNVIWQKDACEQAIRCLFVASSPANILNITGPETLSVRWISERLGESLNKEVQFIGTEQETALLSNASKSHELFGYPQTTIREMIDITAEWLLNDGATIDKPTHFQERKGKY
ncbi:NAD(P)-dependent oxidoreductase [Vagococcus sp. BWB3-3]|uniref:NAD(P)-dependent oxidoreductase n=1 Tax=Vagococcus allomyrinae TaxID=2794353 RepID=A0A940SU00_9ENTE|nr:NAD(P)-dependent oxidoreductase [Vagococcus allomyrinae]MBP1039581.1 NAD(P)-dependent oxidoreductase [Vagococcus allomyrinae]